MKKFLIAVIVIIILLAVSSYIESNYCHSLNRLRTTPPYGGSSTIFCKVNSIPALIGLGIIDFLDLEDNEMGYTNTLINHVIKLGQ